MNCYTPNNSSILLMVRILRRAKRELLQILPLIYVLTAVVPILLLNGLISFPFSVRRGHEATLIFCKNCVVKIAISKKATIEREYLNWVAILQKYPMLAECFPHYMFIRNTFYSCLFSERLFPIPLANCQTSAVYIRNLLDITISPEKRLIFEKYSEIHAGLKYVKTNFGANVADSFSEIVKNYLITDQYRVGLSHGDFHSRNIMRDLNGFDRMIDIDCIRFEGIVELDVLYFVLEMNWSLSGILWTDTLGSAFDMQGENIADSLLAFSVQWSDSLGIIYFLDRVGQELMSYGYHYPKDQIMCVINSMRNAGLIYKEDDGTNHYVAITKIQSK